MAITRITQRMLSDRSLDAVMGGLSRMAAFQEQMETGKKLNRPSDDPAGTSAALRVRASLAEQTQFSRNADDGQAWLSTIDATLGGIASQVQRAGVLATQGANTGAMSQLALDALATEITQIRASVMQQANASYLGRPVFGGTTAGSAAFDTATGDYLGNGDTVAGAVERRVGPGVTVRVDSDGTQVFGADGDNLFTHLDALAHALATGDQAGIEQGIAAMHSDLTRISAAHADEGARANRVAKAAELASQAQLQLKGSLSDVEDVDLAEATINLQTQQVAYQASLAATSKTIQPSLLDFLR